MTGLAAAPDTGVAAAPDTGLAARRARVRIEADDRGVLIEVLDAGMPHASADQAAGHGLKGMRERAAALGGSCEAGPAHGTAWRVRDQIPFHGVGSRP